MKHSKTLILAATLSLALGSATTTLAGETPSRDAMWETIQQQGETIDALRRQMGGGAETGSGWANKLSWSGVVEVEVGTTDNADGNYTDDSAAYADDSSGVTLATVELALDAAIHDLVNAQVVLLYEDNGETPLNVDSATITLGNTERYPLYLTAGLMAVPFGNFSSNVLSDPLTLELGETAETAIQLGFERNGLYGSVYAFNGSANKTNTNSSLDQWGANLGYAMENDRMSLDIGVGFINTLEDSDGISDHLGEDTTGAMADHVAGMAVHGVLGFGGIALIGEYVGATENFAASELPWDGNGAQPAAWNVELGYTFDLSGRETTVAAAWQSTTEFAASDLPEDRYLAAVSMSLFENTALSFEWMHDKDYDTNNGGSGNDADTATAQLAVEF